MNDQATIPATQAERTALLASLYARAFREFGAMALWNLRQFENPTPEQALGITRALRIEGNMDARRLAEQIERVARADH